MTQHKHTKYSKTGTRIGAIGLLRMAMVIAMVCCLTVLSSCSKDPVDEPTIKDEDFRRTVLVYMVANNSLNNYGKQDRKEMLEAAATGSIPKDCQMLLYFLDYSNSPALYRITPDSLERLVDYPSTLSSVSSQRMEEVIADAKRIAPAKEYGMVLWSHASGWYEDGIEKAGNTNEAGASKSRAYVPSTASNKSGTGATTYSFGSTSSNETMNISTLAKVLDGQDMDFLYFDCCFMASTEALYELRNVTKQAYASAAEMHVDGSRWDLVTQDLFAPGKADLVKAAERNFEYYNSLLGSDRTLTVSVTNMEHLQELGQICAEIYEQAPAAYVPTGYSVQNYGYARSYRDAFYDLADYMKVLTRNNPELMERFNECMEKTIAYKAATPYIFGDLKVESHSGLSINIIETDGEANIKNYRDLQWFNDVTKKINY